MRALFYVAGTSPASAFALGPLASSLRAVGHDVLLAGFEEIAPSIVSIGLPAATVANGHNTESIKTVEGREEIGFPHNPDEELPFLGRWFGRQASFAHAELAGLARGWSADVIIGGSLAYGAGLAAAACDLPYVRQSWDLFDFGGATPYAIPELAKEFAETGIETLPPPRFEVDICPPGLADQHGQHFMRWTPHNKQRVIQSWMYSRPPQGRICVTMGSFRSADPRVLHRLCALVEGLLPLGREVVVAAGDAESETIRQRFPAVRAGWIPLETLLPTCDVIVHHAGGLTAINAINAGIPQVILNPFQAYVPPLRKLEEKGCVRTLYREQGTPTAVAEECARILADASYKESARNLAEEALKTPTAPTIVARLESELARS
ncbi:nucleotide disphospho-sugar-binding domain-containing protein [Rhodococcus sp. H29-C3]|uniref:nucleotide disphospho-sugar-binding domain-containing protein n=1 Tax=Rhodococcus sp. H29-C3 TaxID=3046307 RepID=UPI0024BAFCD0|nr:nucleotide disphospho-sugar-binding domain-containing protein [Rhodococcus sp. H29-C3]MDJ0362337.1 DUF1205 domain-containing protein [Rhodococcus sp. H29-C3]